MCGIAGIINFRGIAADEKDLQKMGDCLRFRGPDNYGIWKGMNIGLVHRRLSIIDLSENGNQPMQDAEAEVLITFNGEIYNFLELRKRLQKEGVEFRTHSDTEVIIYGYKKWGIKGILDALDGMFAFAICDLKNQKTYLCRDRFGKKPLYYACIGQQFYFSSDIRSILPFQGSPELDYDSLDYYISEMSAPQPKTIWKGISQVYKSSYITLNTVTGEFSSASYWELGSQPKIEVSFDEAEKLVEKELINAILKRTVSDVPLGCFLSGGIDSGLVVSLLASNTGSRVNTFSVGFAEEEFNELPYARKLAERYNTKHTELIVKPDIRNEITELVDFYGEPFADSSAIPTYYVCREMSTRLKVALSGDGGDELFGYSNYLFMQKADMFASRFRSGIARRVAAIGSKAGSRVSGRIENLGSLEAFLHEAQSGIALLRGMSFVPEEKKTLYTDPKLKEHSDFTSAELKRIWNKHFNGSYADTIFLASLETRLLNDYLVKVDRSSMRSSLEVRSPFLDKSLAELAFRLPNEYKLRGNESKYILKTLASRYIDKDIFSREKKGFGVPVKHWLSNELKDMVQDCLSSEQVKRRGFFNPAYVSAIIAEHNSLRKDHTHKIWSLLWFELWCQRFLNK